MVPGVSALTGGNIGMPSFGGTTATAGTSGTQATNAMFGGGGTSASSAMPLNFQSGSY